MTGEKHPRDETQAERDKAYRDLTKLVKRAVFRHGKVILLPESVASGMVLASSSATGWETAEGAVLHLILLNGEHVVDGPHRAVSVIKMHDRELLGRQTDYVSINDGPFTRTDIDGRARGAPSTRLLLEASKQDPVLGAVMAEAGIMLIEGQTAKDRVAGIDGLPISAFETRELIQEIELGKPTPMRDTVT